MDCNEKYDAEKRMWNDSVHILSDRPELAFAWAAYFAERSNIYANGKEYRVEHIFNAGLEFANGTYLPFGNYVMFKSKVGLTVYTYEYLQGLRKHHQLPKCSPLLKSNFFLNIIKAAG